MQKPTYKHNKRIRKRAFTLVELLIVIAIIGILFVVLIGRVDFASNKAKTSGVQTDLRAFSNAAHMSAVDHQTFLSDKNKLADSLNSYLDEELKVNYTTDIFVDATDPWGNNYEFMQFTPIGTRGEVVFFSKGPDGIAFNNDDEVAMITYYDNLNSEIVITYPMESPHIHVFEAYESEQAYKEKGNCQSPATYYYSCRGCGMKKYDTFTSGMPDMSNHIDEVFAGTKTAHTKCSGCNTTISAEHKFVETVETAATCTSKGKSKYTCECGYSYTDANIPIDPNNHSRDLTLVGTKEVHSKYYCCNTIVGDESAHTYTKSVLWEADCLFEGTSKYSCECGYYYTVKDIPIDPNNHFGLGTIKNGGMSNSHKEYSCCGKVVEDGSYHVFDKGTVLFEADCLFEGTSKYSCECGYYYTVKDIPIDPNNHFGLGTIKNGGTSNSHKEYSCCHVVVEDGSYHVFDEGTVLFEADCLFEGTSKYSCECGYYYTVKDIPIDPNNHFGNGTIKNGSTSNSHKEYSCCHVVVEDGSYHVFDEGTVLFEADCLFEGTSKYSCECGYYYTVKDIPIDPNNHFGLGTIKNGGTSNSHKEYSCCHVVVEDGSAHTYTKSVLWEADCLFEGTSKYSCECGYYYTVNDIPIDPDNHFGNGTIKNGSTSNSHKEYSCCHVVVEDGSYHVFTTTVYDPGDCLFTGTYRHACDCGYVKYTYDVPVDPENHYLLKTNYESVDSTHHNKIISCYGCDYHETIQEQHVLENNACTSCTYKKED